MTECGPTHELDLIIAHQARALRRELSGTAAQRFRIFVDVSAGQQSLAEVIERQHIDTGNSSLSLIRQFPLDGLKIDGSFVQGMSSDPADAALVASVAALGRRLGLSITAEGVETEHELSAVTEEGVDLAQGFLFHLPSRQPQ